MSVKLYFKDAYFYWYLLNEKGEIIDRSDVTLEEMIKKHGEPVKFVIMIGV